MENVLDIKGFDLKRTLEKTRSEDVAEALARGLRYTPLSAPKLVEQVTGQSAAEILAEEGDAGLTW